MNVFHEHDSEDRLIAKKDALELKNWIDHLLYNGEDLDILINIAEKLPVGEELVRTLKEIVMENKLRLGVFYRYKNSMINIHECEDMECDIYYLNKHEEYRSLYGSILDSLHKVKVELYTKILVAL